MRVERIGLLSGYELLEDGELSSLAEPRAEAGEPVEEVRRHRARADHHGDFALQIRLVERVIDVRPLERADRRVASSDLRRQHVGGELLPPAHRMCEEYIDLRERLHEAF